MGLDLADSRAHFPPVRRSRAPGPTPARPAIEDGTLRPVRGDFTDPGAGETLLRARERTQRFRPQTPDGLKGAPDGPDPWRVRNDDTSGAPVRGFRTAAAPASIPRIRDDCTRVSRSSTW